MSRPCGSLSLSYIDGFDQDIDMIVLAFPSIIKAKRLRIIEKIIIFKCENT